MRPYFLKFPDRATAEAAGAQWMRRDDKGNVIEHVDTPIWTYHVVGTIYTPAVLDAKGNVVTPAVAKPGFHVNVLAEPERWPAELDQFLVDPVTPESIFAGMPAVRPKAGWGDV